MQTLEDRALDGPLGGVTDEQSSPDVTSGIDQPGPGFIPPPPPSVPSSGSWVPSEMAMQVMGLIVLAVFVGIVIYSVGAGLLLRNSTPTGGDMGAHVWAPDAVRRELLPHGRLIGWSDDWYAGFPVLGFYFPFPTWAITLLSFLMPYNIGFKLITVSGLIQASAQGLATVWVAIAIIRAWHSDATSTIVSAGAPTRTVQRSEIPVGRAVFDIDQASVDHFAQLIATARTVIWNGPMGVFETPPFDAGTLGVARALAKATAAGATTIVGGGDSAAAVTAAGLDDNVTHVSTGGGASLEFLEGKPLPGVAALDDAT